MSSFIFTAKDRQTGEHHRAWAFDDYFGKHEYGYKLLDAEKVYTEDEFWQRYERVRDL